MTWTLFWIIWAVVGILNTFYWKYIHMMDNHKYTNGNRTTNWILSLLGGPATTFFLVIIWVCELCMKPSTSTSTWWDEPVKKSKYKAFKEHDN